MDSAIQNKYQQVGLIRANDKKYSIDEIHNLFRFWKTKYEGLFDLPQLKGKKIKDEFDGFPVKPYSHRYRVFLNGCTCIKCGLKASYYRLEKRKESSCFHFNLYGIDKDDNEVLFTKDHILPASLGGKDHYSNYQTMCYVCNCAKGNTVEEN